MYKLENIELRDYQKRVLKDLNHLDSIALFLGTGSGKTITSLQRFCDNKTNNLLVICPQKVVTQWNKTIKESIKNIELVDLGLKKTALIQNESLLNLTSKNNIAIVVNYEKIAKLSNLKKLIDSNWTIILDESHTIKELGTKKSPRKANEAVLELKDYTPYKIILTATPTEKKNGGYIDYYNQLKFLGYMDMSINNFKDKFCVEIKKQIPGMPYPIKIIDRYKNVEYLQSLLKQVARRYIPKFGEYEPEHIKVDIPKTKTYNKFKENSVYKELTCDNISAKRVALKTLTGGIITGTNEEYERVEYSDNSHKTDWLKEFLQNTNETVVIFYKYNVEKRQLVDMCEELNEKYEVISGEVSDKYDIVNNKEYRVLIGQINALGEAIDGLQHKSHICVYYSMPESSREYIQSLGRIDRDGQKNVPTYYYLVMEHTIDSLIYDLVNQKVEFTEEVLNKLDI